MFKETFFTSLRRRKHVLAFQTRLLVFQGCFWMMRKEKYAFNAEISYARIHVIDTTEKLEKKQTLTNIL